MVENTDNFNTREKSSNVLNKRNDMKMATLSKSSSSINQNKKDTTNKKETSSIFNFFTKSTNRKKNNSNSSSLNAKQQLQRPQTAASTSSNQKIDKTKIRCQVTYLDETVRTFDLDKSSLGQELFDRVCNDLELVEKEYFSLTFRDANNMKFWLDHEKKLKSQLKGMILDTTPVFNFEVKFYPPEPKLLHEDITRYLITLQLRHDVMDGKLPCSFVTHALLGSFTVQAEIGDYDPSIHQGREYLEGFFFAPNQTDQLLDAVAEYHKDHRGQTPEEAELHFLENAVKLAMYGVDLHNAKDSDGIDILLGVSASGLMVYRDHLRINRFSWPKILKISYKRNYFYLKLRAAGSERYDSTIGFRCPNHKAAKRLWKIAVEHHAFFRLREPEKPKKNLIPNFNEKFRYTGSSTYMQTRQRSIERQQPGFARSLSKRLTQSMDRMSGATTPGANSLILQNKSTLSIPNKMNLRESDEEDEYEVHEQPRLPDLSQRPPQQQQQIRIPDASNMNLPQLNQNTNDLNDDFQNSYQSQRSMQNDPNFKASTPILNKIQQPRYVPPKEPIRVDEEEVKLSTTRPNLSQSSSPSFKNVIPQSVVNQSPNIGPYSPVRPSKPTPLQTNSSLSYKGGDSTSSSPMRNNSSSSRPPMPAERGRLNSSREMQLEYERRQKEAEEEEEAQAYQQHLLEQQRKNLEQQQRRKLELQNLERRQRELEAEKEAQRKRFDEEQEELKRRQREQEELLILKQREEEAEERRRKQLEEEQRKEGERLRLESIRRKQELDAIRRKQEEEMRAKLEEQQRQQKELEARLARQRLAEEQQRQEEEMLRLESIRRKQEEEMRAKLEEQQRQQKELEAKLARQRLLDENEQKQNNQSSIVSPTKPKVEKTMVVNATSNHKDALLNAIRMATELDPNFEVEKVEITNGD